MGVHAEVGMAQPSILAIFMANAEGHIAILHGREGLQWERDLVPLHFPRLPSGHRPLSPAAQMSSSCEMPTVGAQGSQW